MSHRRRGYTLTEMMIVVVVIGGLALMTLPKFSGLAERSRISAARQEVTAAIATARAAAIQKGTRSTVKLVRDTLTVWVTNTNGGTTTLVGPKPIHALYRVEMGVRTAADTAITFDMRGFARLASTGVVRLTGPSRRDSVCLTMAGQIMPRGCSL